MTIGITGIDGMIGWHLHAYLKCLPEVNIIGANRATFASRSDLDDFVAASDVIVHLAGMNRGDDAEIESINIGLAEDLIAACERTRRRPHIIFASSTHIIKNTAYGRSKLECAERFRAWAEKNQASFTNLILPHVFGEGGRPFYNSVVSTFCYQLARGEAPEILHDGDLELVHAQQVADRVVGLINDCEVGDVRVAGVAIKVSELLVRLKDFDELYRSQLLPELQNEIDLFLFNTYKSYLYPEYYPVCLKQHEDNRGSLYEAVKTHNGGQCFISSTKPGVTRGNHYHMKKIERFLVLHGNAVIRIRRLFSDEVNEFEVSGDKPEFIDIPTLHTHNISNIGESDMTTLFWSNEIFDPASPDTFAEQV